MTQKIRVRQLKAYSIHFTVDSKEDAEEQVHYNVKIIAYNREEAIDIFTKLAIAKKLYDEINYISIETIHKIKRNPHISLKEFYIKQNDFVNKLYEVFKNK